MKSDSSCKDRRNATLKYYEDNAKAFVESTRAIDMQSLYEPFLSLLPKNAHILDAGCGPGRDTLYFLNHGYRVTAFDASETMVSMAAQLTSLPVLRLYFQQIEFKEGFDAIWACASLLHVSRHEMNDVIGRIVRSLKPGGAFYASFKYGNGESIRNGRFFNDYDEQSFDELIRNYSSIELLRTWRTLDIRQDRMGESWLNVLMKKLDSDNPQ